MSVRVCVSVCVCVCVCVCVYVAVQYVHTSIQSVCKCICVRECKMNIAAYQLINACSCVEFPELVNALSIRFGCTWNPVCTYSV